MTIETDIQALAMGCITNMKGTDGRGLKKKNTLPLKRQDVMIRV